MISQILTVASRWQFLMLCVTFQFLPALEPYGWPNLVAHVIVHCISNYWAFLTIPKPNSKLTILNIPLLSLFKKGTLFWGKVLFWLEQNAYSNIFVGGSELIRISLFSRQETRNEKRDPSPLQKHATIQKVYIE